MYSALLSVMMPVPGYELPSTTGALLILPGNTNAADGGAGATVPSLLYIIFYDVIIIIHCIPGLQCCCAGQ